MFSIKTLNKISKTGLSALENGNFTVSDAAENEEGILVRSADLHDYPMPESLLAIARAGAGVNNIPVADCSEKGIVVFNTPGANANAVKELVICALLLASRKVTGGVEWVKAQAAQGIEVADVVEKGKGQFAGPEIAGKTLGVIGLGAIGVQVANIATKLGMNVLGYDPYLSVNSALSLSRLVTLPADLDTIYRSCDYITLHLPLMDATRGMVDAAAIEKMKDGARIVNMARGALVKEDDLLAALESGKLAAYVTDFPTSKVAGGKNVVAIPHLGASTPESEDNCAVMAANQLRDYLENGNIKNSVNLPDLSQEWTTSTRLCILHRNIPAMLSSVTAALAAEGINVETMSNKSKGDYAYTLVDVSAPVSDQALAHIRGIEGILRLRPLTR